ncbi:aspartate aminotransferase family protein [Streptomyces sp. NPDC056500]|uniref:class-III pyridoxal-phosphate-dependent aminotransferase n=1 Tax=Streptomyces sp. NPDC056500 TaxID=3345840 RepID=UPI0036CC28F8
MAASPQSPPKVATAQPGATFDRLRRHLSREVALTAESMGNGAVEASAAGASITLSDRRTALDFGSYSVALLGHRHPGVVEAVHRQLATMPTSTRALANPVTAEAAATLVDYFGGALPKVHFGLNGSDAVEAAVKLARLATGRDRVLAVRGGYHGTSLGALALTHHPGLRAGLRGCVSQTVHLDPFEPSAVMDEIARGPVAALVFEPVQGENGAFPLPTDVLHRWALDARAHGAFVIADEIQSGLRRCGERSVALAEGLPVDAVLTGGPLGGGVMPLSAVVCTEVLYRPLGADPLLHTTTFGGHPLSCAALPAALDAIEGLADHGRSLADGLANGLRGLHDLHPRMLSGFRGRGLLWSIGFTAPHMAGEVMVRLADAGLLVSPCLSDPRSVRLLPPLTTTHAELDQALGILDSALTDVARRGTF